MTHPIDAFNDWFFNFLGRWLLVLLFLAIAIIIAAIAIGGKNFTCSHPPHMGSCKVTSTTYYLDPKSHIMMPITSTCGCTSDHGAVKLEDAK